MTFRRPFRPEISASNRKLDNSIREQLPTWAWYAQVEAIDGITEDTEIEEGRWGREGPPSWKDAWYVYARFDAVGSFVEREIENSGIFWKMEGASFSSL